MTVYKIELGLEREEREAIRIKLKHDDYKITSISINEVTAEHVLKYKDGEPCLVEELRIIDESVAIETLELSDEGTWSCINRLFMSKQILDEDPIKLV